MFHGILRGTGGITHLTGIHGVRFTGTLITAITITGTTIITGITALGITVVTMGIIIFTTIMSDLILRELITELSQDIIILLTHAPTLEKRVKHFTPEQIQNAVQEHVITLQLMVAE